MPSSGNATVVTQVPSPLSLDGPAKASPALMEANYVLLQLETGYPGLESLSCSLDFKILLRCRGAEDLRTQDLGSNPSSICEILVKFCFF